MPRSSPPLVPAFDFEVCVVLDDYGKIGCAYREVDVEETDRETVIRNIMTGQYEKPIQIVAFNTAEGWSRDITEDIAREIAERDHSKGLELGFTATRFVEYFADGVR